MPPGSRARRPATDPDPGGQGLGVAPPLAEALREGARWPLFLTVGLVGGFVACAAYLLSGAGVVRPLPKLDAGLLAIGAVFTLRGLGGFYFLYLLLVEPTDSTARELVFCLVSLTVGLLILIGRRQRRTA